MPEVWRLACGPEQDNQLNNWTAPCDNCYNSHIMLLLLLLSPPKRL
jgi:hypothetical protein